MGQLVNVVLNRRELSSSEIEELMELHKLQLLFQKKYNSKVPENFIRIVKKCEDKVKVIEVVNDILEALFLNRNCKMNINFMFYLIRKLSTLKAAVFDKCSEIEVNSQNMRPAQKKQMDKLRSKLMKSVQNVKN